MIHFRKCTVLSLLSMCKTERSVTNCVDVCYLSDEAAGTLKLNNLSSNMSGKYECTASNSAGEAKCYINLEVITCKSYWFYFVQCILLSHQTKPQWQITKTCQILTGTVNTSKSESACYRPSVCTVYLRAVIIRESNSLYVPG